jgi:hypothetical protein
MRRVPPHDVEVVGAEENGTDLTSEVSLPSNRRPVDLHARRSSRRDLHFDENAPVQRFHLPPAVGGLRPLPHERRVRGDARRRERKQEVHAFEQVRLPLAVGSHRDREAVGNGVEVRVYVVAEVTQLDPSKAHQRNALRGTLS